MNDATEFGLAVDLAKSRLEERIKKILLVIVVNCSGPSSTGHSARQCLFRIVLREPRPAESVAWYSGAGGVAIGFRSVDLKKLRGETGAALAIVSRIN